MIEVLFCNLIFNNIALAVVILNIFSMIIKSVEIGNKIPLFLTDFLSKKYLGRKFLSERSLSYLLYLYYVQEIQSVSLVQKLHIAHRQILSGIHINFKSQMVLCLHANLNNCLYCLPIYNLFFDSKAKKALFSLKHRFRYQSHWVKAWQENGGRI